MKLIRCSDYWNMSEEERNKERVGIIPDAVYDKLLEVISEENS